MPFILKYFDESHSKYKILLSWRALRARLKLFISLITSVNETYHRLWQLLCHLSSLSLLLSQISLVFYVFLLFLSWAVRLSPSWLHIQCFISLLAFLRSICLFNHPEIFVITTVFWNGKKQGQIELLRLYWSKKLPGWSNSVSNFGLMK